MDSNIFTCERCGLKSRVLAEQLCGHIYCHRCIAKSESCGQQVCSLNHSSSRFIPNIGSYSQLDEELCCYCKAVLDLNNIKKHYDICDKFPVNCHFCNGQFLRQIIRIHVQECVRNLRPCKFSQIGCQFQGTQLEIKGHESDTVHVELIMNLLLNIQIEQSKTLTELQSVKDVIKKTQCKLDDIIQKNSSSAVECKSFNNLQQEMIELKIELKQSSKKMDQLGSQNTHLENNYEALNKQQNQQVENFHKVENTLTTVITANNKLTETLAEDKKLLNDKIDTIIRKQSDFEEHCRNEKDKIEKNYNRQSQELMSCRTELTSKLSSFQYIWKVEKFAQLQEDAKSSNRLEVYSDPFYSNKFGYKMRLVVYPDGFKEGKGTHLSTYLQVMKGSNDAILNWPIEYAGELTVIDQSKQKNHHSYQLKSDLIQCAECYAKPISEHNLGCGFPTFIAFDKIKPLYLVNDTVFLKLDLNITC